MVFDEVALPALLLTRLGLVSDGDLRAVGGVVEVDDVDVEHEDG